MFNIFSSPSFWLFVSFSFFALLIVRPIVSIIISNLDYHRNTISEQLNDSKRSREEAESFLEEAQKQRRVAKKESERIIANALEEGKCLSEDSHKKLADFLKNEEKRTEANIARLESESIMRLQDKVFDVSFQFSKRILSDFSSQSQDFRSSLDKETLKKLREIKF